MTLAQTNVILALVLAAIVVVILGMGVPTTAAYVIGIAVAGAGLVQMGLLPLAVHMFIFYFACVSEMTPPVCITVFTAASIAKTNWVRVAFIALRLGIIAYFVPFLFVYSPSLLAQAPVATVLTSLGLALLAVFFIAVGLSGWFLRRLFSLTRVLFLVVGVLLVLPFFNPDFSAMAILAILVLIIALGTQWVYQILQKKKTAKEVS
jgi:TRAP-type uncharacterized transport system fused permease subunit